MTRRQAQALTASRHQQANARRDALAQFYAHRGSRFAVPPAPGTAPAPPADTSSPADDPKASPGPPLPKTKAAGDDPTPDRPGNAPDEATDNNVACADPDCAHFASAHDDTDTGANTGACGMANCACNGMRIPDADPVPAEGSEEKPGNDPTAATSAQGGNAFAGTDPPPAAVPAPVDDPTDGSGPSVDDGIDAPDDTTGSPAEQGAPQDGNTQAGGPALDTGEELLGPAFTIPVGIIEGIPTSDGRFIQPNALTWRTPPMPLLGLNSSPHGGMPMTDALVCGRIEEFFRDGNVIGARGHFDASKVGEEFAGLVDRQMITGVSGDVFDVTEEVTVDEIDDDGWPLEMSSQITKGEIAGFTICPFPAFPGAYIVLGDGTDSTPPAIPQTDSNNAGMSINVMRSVDCGCDEAATDTPGTLLAAAGAPLRPPRAWFANPELTELTKLRYDDNGRVYGHVAARGACHTGYLDTCVVPPMDQGSDYSLFLTGYVETAEGDIIPTGPVTYGTDHASPYVSAFAAGLHYANTGSVGADVTLGEDEFGIWAAGAVIPGTTPETIHRLRASAVSGDWRPLGINDELIAVLAVNTPGFPIKPVALMVDGERKSLVAAGVIQDGPAGPSDEDRLARLERQFAAVVPTARQNLRERFSRTRVV